MQSNPYIILEGIDGCGKDKHLEAICAKQSLTRLREPDPETPVGAHLCKILRKELPQPSAIEMLGLFLLGRSLRSRSFPHGGVISNRSFVSSMVYQRGEHLCPLAIYQAHLPLIAAHPPTVIAILDCSIETALSRIAKRPETELFETENALRWAQEGYNIAARLLTVFGHKVVRVSTEADFKTVHEQLVQALEL